MRGGKERAGETGEGGVEAGQKQKQKQIKKKQKQKNEQKHVKGSDDADGKGCFV
jgi:hypothetical protein